MSPVILVIAIACSLGYWSHHDSCLSLAHKHYITCSQPSGYVTTACSNSLLVTSRQLS